MENANSRVSWLEEFSWSVKTGNMQAHQKRERALRLK